VICAQVILSCSSDSLVESSCYGSRKNPIKQKNRQENQQTVNMVKKLKKSVAIREMAEILPKLFLKKRLIEVNNSAR